MTVKNEETIIISYEPIGMDEQDNVKGDKFENELIRINVTNNEAGLILCYI